MRAAAALVAIPPRYGGNVGKTKRMLQFGAEGVLTNSSPHECVPVMACTPRTFGGTLAPVRTDDLAALALTKLLERHPNLDPMSIGDVLLGCANQAGEDNRNVARMASLLAGLPQEVPAETVNRLCASGLAASVHAARMLHTNDANLVLAGGVEHMTRGPWVLSKASKPFGRDMELHDTSFGWRFVNPRLEALYGVEGMGQTAENLVDLHGISREDQDAFAYRSQMKAAAAQAEGRLAEEIVAVDIPRRKQEDLRFEVDEFIKPNTTIEVLSSLRPAFRKEGGSVTAGNASGLNDGAAALLLANEAGLKDRGLDAWQKLSRLQWSEFHLASWESAQLRQAIARWPKLASPGMSWMSSN